MKWQGWDKNNVPDIRNSEGRRCGYAEDSKERVVLDDRRKIWDKKEKDEGMKRRTKGTEGARRVSLYAGWLGPTSRERHPFPSAAPQEAGCASTKTVSGRGNVRADAAWMRSGGEDGWILLLPRVVGLISLGR